MSICGKNACKKCEYKDRCANSDARQQTNEEWLRQATTDGMTEIFMRFMFDAEFKARFVNGNFINEFRKWLKEKHDEDD